MYQALRELIDRLVDQFSDPYAFLRELVQNSLDAGSSQLDFELEHSQGTTVLTCHDTGEGMDEQLIDTRLTRIFSSSKEDDLTKIGQFGIGFLSVFALKPDHVVVDTGRNGQAWRVHFAADHSFSKTPLAEAVDGTRIRWVKCQPAREHRDFEQKCRQALEHWCRHAQARISWKGRALNQPFEFEHRLAVRAEGPGTQVSIRPGLGWLGLYNQGLTLSEGSEDLWPGLDVKINSRYLTHTLTRDRVVRDENFAKARRVVDGAIQDSLLPRLLRAGELGLLAAQLGRLSPDQRRLPLVDGWSVNQLAGRKLFLVCTGVDPLVERLRGQGQVVLQQRPGLKAFLRALESRASLVEVHNSYVLPELVKATGLQQMWLQRLVRTLAGLGEFYQAVWLAELPSRLAVLGCYQPQEPVPLRFEKRVGEAPQLLVNVLHPLWSGLWELEEDWGEAALCQSLWTAFPHLFKNEQARLELVHRNLGTAVGPA